MDRIACALCLRLGTTAVGVRLISGIRKRWYRLARPARREQGTLSSRRRTAHRTECRSRCEAPDVFTLLPQLAMTIQVPEVSPVRGPVSAKAWTRLLPEIRSTR